jgi:hypothetical protein
VLRDRYEKMYCQIRDSVIGQVQGQAEKGLGVANGLIEQVIGIAKDKMRLDRIVKGKIEELEGHRVDTHSRENLKSLRISICLTLSDLSDTLTSTKTKL